LNTDVSDLRDCPLEALSGGEKQRAVIAMALAQEHRATKQIRQNYTPSLPACNAGAQRLRAG